jgi:PRTRC genetic system protein C
MLVTTTLQRVFIHKLNGQDVRLTDPNPSLNALAVQHFYANTYPILTTAKIRGPEIIDDEVRYLFETSMGTKG